MVAVHHIVASLRKQLTVAETERDQALAYVAWLEEHYTCTDCRGDGETNRGFKMIPCPICVKKPSRPEALARMERRLRAEGLERAVEIIEADPHDEAPGATILDAAQAEREGE